MFQTQFKLSLLVSDSSLESLEIRSLLELPTSESRLEALTTQLQELEEQPTGDPLAHRSEMCNLNLHFFSSYPNTVEH